MKIGLQTGQSCFSRMDVECSRMGRWLSLLWLGVCVSQGQAACPEPCQCLSPGGLDVDCSNRDLTALPPDLPTNITGLNLTGNYISRIDGGMFEGFSSLAELDMTANGISYIADTGLGGLTSLITLHLRGNNITDLPDNVFDLVSNSLTYLDLSGNLLQSLPSGIEECVYLTQLKLGYNKFNNSVFTDLNKVPSLVTVNLSRNPVKALPYLSMHNMFLLQFLNLEQCEISLIDNNAFVRLSSLAYLHMSHNEIEMVNREMLQPLNKLAELDISDNPLVCSCHTKQLQDLLTENSIALRPAVKCTVPDGSGMQIDIANGDLEFLCQGHGPTVPPASVSCDNVSVAVFVEQISDQHTIVLWKYTEDTSYSDVVFSYRRFGIQTPVLEKTLLSNTTKYDLFDLDAGTSYIACVYLQDCDVTSCSDFIVPADHNTPACPIYLAVGLTVAVFIFIILVFMLTRFVLLWKKHGKGMLKSFKTGPLTKRYSTPNNTLARGQQNTVIPEPAVSQPVATTPSQRVSMTARSEHPYEAIPADAHGAFTNLGYLHQDDHTQTLQEIPAAANLPVENNNNTLTAVSDEYLTPVASSTGVPSQTSTRQCACSFLEVPTSEANPYHKYEEPRDVTIGPHSQLNAPDSHLTVRSVLAARQLPADLSNRRAQSEGLSLSMTHSRNGVLYGSMPHSSRHHGRRPLPRCSCGNHLCTLSRPLPATPVDRPITAVEQSWSNVRWQSSLQLTSMSAECEV